MSDLPPGWQPASFGELMAPEPNSLTDGPFGSKLKTAHYVADGPRVIRLGNIGVGEFLGQDEAHITDEHYATLLKHRVFAGDLLIAGLADPAGRCCIAPNTLRAAVVKADCFRAKPHADVSNAYLMRYLNSPQGRAALEANSHGLGRLRINLQDLKAVEVPLAPAPEQRRIVTKLDSLFARTRSAREELARIPRLIEHYKQAILAAAFRGELTADWRQRRGEDLASWATRELDSLLGGIKAGKNLRCEERPPNDNERGVVKVSAVTWGTFDVKEAKTLPPHFDPAPDTLIQPRDFLFSRANTIELVGACVVVGETPGNLYLSDKVLRLSMPDEAKPWLLWFLRSPQGRRQLEGASTGNQLSMRNISQAALRKVQIPWPTVQEREAILQSIRTATSWLEGVLAEHSAAAKLLDHLDQATLAKAFRGELVPQDPNDEPAAVLLERIRAARAAEPKPKRRRRKAATG